MNLTYKWLVGLVIPIIIMIAAAWVNKVNASINTAIKNETDIEYVKKAVERIEAKVDKLLVNKR